MENVKIQMFQTTDTMRAVYDREELDNTSARGTDMNPRCNTFAFAPAIRIVRYAQSEQRRNRVAAVELADELVEIP
jgi:hypothetical protein